MFNTQLFRFAAYVCVNGMCEYIDVYGGIGSGFECRCGGLFCAVHRYSDKHECSFDYRELGAQEIRRNNPVVVSQKIHKIWACPPVRHPPGGGPPSPHRITYVLWFSLNKYSIEFVFLICILYVFLTAGRRRRAVVRSVSISFLFYFLSDERSSASRLTRLFGRHDR